MDPPPPRVPSPLQIRKHAAILDGARTIFLRDGFGGSSMDEVARAAGVGKQTVYRHFGSKEALFEDLLGEMCSGAFEAPVQNAGSFAETLREVGRSFISVVIDPINLALFRVVVAETERFPALAQRFHAATVTRAVTHVADLIMRHTGLDEDRAQQLAATFLEMVKGPALLRLLLGASAALWNASFERQTDQAVAYVMSQTVAHEGRRRGRA